MVLSGLSGAKVEVACASVILLCVKGPDPKKGSFGEREASKVFLLTALILTVVPQSKGCVI